MSPTNLPLAWVCRIFDRLEGLYGAKFHDAWKGTNLENVKATWAEKLAGFTDRPDCLKSALDACDEKPWPPTLPEFLLMCRDAAKRNPPKPLSIEHKFTEEEMQKNRERLAQIQRDLAEKMGGYSD